MDLDNTDEYLDTSYENAPKADLDKSYNITNNQLDLMKKTYYYPESQAPDLVEQLYKKREFHYSRIPARPDITNITEIQKYREDTCERNFALHEHQTLLSNFINPNTPYTGLLVFHGLGTGKCLTGDTVCDIFDNLHTHTHTSKITLEAIWNTYSDTNIIIDKENGEWSNLSSKLYIDSYTNPLTNTVSRQPIKRLYREYIQSWIREIILTNGDRIKTTLIHKFLTNKNNNNNNNNWSNNISVGDSIGIYKNGQLSWQPIQIINIYKYTGYVYDLEIAQTHNYVANNIFCHNTCAGIAIAEKFKSQVQRYNTKIHILVSGPLIKENWKYHLIKCTGDTYTTYQNKGEYQDSAEKKKQDNIAQRSAMQ
jgi:hypothetical protein